MWLFRLCRTTVNLQKCFDIHLCLEWQWLLLLFLLFFFTSETSFKTWCTNSLYFLSKAFWPQLRSLVPSVGSTRCCWDIATLLAQLSSLSVAANVSCPLNFAFSRGRTISFTPLIWRRIWPSVWLQRDTPGILATSVNFYSNFWKFWDRILVEKKFAFWNVLYLGFVM